MWTNCVFMRLAWEAVTCQVQWNLQFSNTIETQLIQQTVICITIKYSNVLALPQHFTNRLSLTLLELNGGGDAGTDTFSSHPTFVFRSCQYNNVILTRSNEYDNICKQTTCRCIDMFQHASLALRSKLLQLLHQAVSQSASVILSCLLSGFHVHLCVLIVFHETMFDSTIIYMVVALLCNVVVVAWSKLSQLMVQPLRQTDTGGELREVLQVGQVWSTTLWDNVSISIQVWYLRFAYMEV